MIDILPVIADTYGTAAAALAADWYETHRIDQGIRGSYAAAPAALPTQDRYVSMARWAVGHANVRTLVAGGMQRVIANAARQTITAATADDPQAAGWQRVARATGCPFCQMLAGRGTTYTRASADFASHDNCDCTATVAWLDRPVPVKPYTPSLREISDVEKARVRSWIATNMN